MQDFQLEQNRSSHLCATKKKHAVLAHEVQLQCVCERSKEREREGEQTGRARGQRGKERERERERGKTETDRAREVDRSEMYTVLVPLEMS